MIKNIRENVLKMTQVQLASALQMTQANLSRIEGGAQKATPEVAIKIERLSNGVVSRAEIRPDIFINSE